MFVWLNGEVVDVDAARVSPLDHGLTVGDGVFETLRVYDGVPFAWTRHLDRMERSAAGLGIHPPDRDALRSATVEVLDANGLDDARLRLTCTSGDGPPGSARGRGPALATVIAVPVGPVEPSADVVSVPWTRNEHGALTGLKTTSYGENVRALAYASEQHAHEAIFANTHGELCEGTGTNVFVVHDGVVRTPPLASGCLAGITRALVLELCAAHLIPHEEAALAPVALTECDEAFITSSVREVLGIAAVDGQRLPTPHGPVTERLVECYQELVATTADP